MEFMEKERNQFNTITNFLAEGLTTVPEQIATNNFDISKLKPRVALKSMPYVNHIVNEH